MTAQDPSCNQTLFAYEIINVLSVYCLVVYTVHPYFCITEIPYLIAENTIAILEEIKPLGSTAAKL